MAQRVQVLLVDDIDGGNADETVTFGLDGSTYEIDLSVSNAAKLRHDLAEWIGHGRRGSGRRVAKRGAARRSNLNDVRDWGRSNGFKVSDRGRVSADLQSAYDKAHR